MPVAEPQKELRFTRAGQAVGFWIAAAVCIMAGLVFFLLIPYREDHPILPHPAWGFAPILFAGLLIRTAWRCTKHAYILLSPIGVEVFPFLRPEKHMQVILWQQIVAADVTERLMTLHFSEDRTSGIHLSLAPISKDRRPLLKKAILGRIES